MSQARAVCASVAGAYSVLPVFVAGSLSVVIADDIPLSGTTLGLVVAGFFVGSTTGAAGLGSLADRWGPRRTTVLGSAILCVAMLATATVATRELELIGLTVLAGMANGAIQPSSNLAVSRSVGIHQLGLAFGVKQAMVPGATMLAGLLLPLVGLTIGWRWVYIGLAIGALLLPVLIPKTSDEARSQTASSQADTPLAWPLTALLAVTSGLASAASVALAGFYVPAAVASGISPAIAGLLLTGGSCIMIVTRLVFGWLADKYLPTIPFVCALLAVGAAGYTLLALGTVHLAVVIAGTLLAFGAGWGWPGLVFMAVARANPHRAGAATGIIQAGTSIGAISGSLGFGLAAATSYQLAWTLAAGLVVVAVAVIATVVRGGAATSRYRQS